MLFLILIFSFIIGACFGSFLCCQARRLRLKEQKKKPLGSRSVCLYCRHQLKWHDNLPIISWLALKGKCRHCHKKIGFAEFISEIGTGIAFVMLTCYALSVGGAQIFLARTSYLIGAPLPLIIATGIALSVLALLFIFLAIYDGLYGELPTFYLILSIVCAVAFLILKDCLILSTSSFTSDFILKPLFAILILGGLYLVLYLISKGRWVGDGDWILGTAIAIALADPWLALIALFIANFTACVTMYPIVKSHKNHKIHFGPFLVAAFIITTSFSEFFLNMI